MRVWTAKERDLLVARRPGATVAGLARLLGRSESSVRGALGRFGCRVLPPRDPVPEAELRRLHAMGLDDATIARRTGRGRNAVYMRRRGLGLPANGVSGGYDPARRRGAMMATARRHGVSRLHQLLQRRLAGEAARRGWPGAASPRHADVLDALEAAGPLSAPTAAGLVGMRPSRAWRLLRDLEGLGLVRRYATARPILYALAVQRRRAEVGVA